MQPLPADDPVAAPMSDLPQRTEVSTPSLSPDPADLSLDELKRLVHQLQDRQIKLETQNEELRRRQANSEVSRARYVELFDFAPIGYLTLSPTGHILTANLAAAALLGVDRSRLIDQQMSRFIVGEDQGVYDSHRQQLLDTGTPQTCELRLMGQDGAPRRVRLQTVAAQDSNQLLEYRVVLSDITDFKRAEAALQVRLRLSQFADTHNLEDLLQKSLDEAEALTDSQIGFFHFVDADQKTLHLQMWSTNTLQTMCTAEGRGQHYDIDQAGVWVECAHTRRPVIHNDYARLMHRKGLPDGHTPVVRELVVPVLRNDAIVAILGVGNKPTDYTDQDIHVVEQLANLTWDVVLRKRAEDALRKSEEKYRTVADFTYDWEAWRAPDGAYLYVSPSCERITGRPIAQFMADSNLMLHITHPDDQPQVMAHLDAVARQVSEQDLHLDFRILTSSGETRWISHYCTPVYGDDGRCLGRRESNRDITERKHAEQELRKLSRAVEQSPATIVITSLAGDIEYVNPKFTQTTGYTFDEVIGKNPRILKSGHTPTHEYRRLWATIRSGGEWRGEFHNRKKNGDLYWEAATIAPVWNERGEITHFLAVKEDITDRVHTVEALRESERRFRTLFEEMVSGFALNEIIRDENGRPVDYVTLEVNREFEKLLNVSRADVIGRRAYETVPDLDRAWLDIFGKVTLTGEPCHYQQYAANVNKWFEGVAFSPEKGRFAVTFVDVTARRQAEEALRQSEERHWIVLQTAMNGFWLVDMQGRLTEVNDTYCRMSGYSRQELLNMHIFDLEAVETADDIAVHIQKIVAQGEDRFESRHRRKDGSIFIVEVSVQYRPTQGEWIVVFIQDITEYRRLNQALELHTRELGALNRASRAIASTLDLDMLLELIISEIKNLIDAESASVLLYEPATDELIFSAVVGPRSEQLLHTRMPATAGIAGWVLREKRSAFVGDAQLDPRHYPPIDQLTGHLTYGLLAVPLLAKGQPSGVVEAVNKRNGSFDEGDLEILEGLAAAAAIAIENARLYQQEREQFNRLQQTQAQMIHFEKMAALGRLVASIAHEINNPLQAVQGCIGLASEELAGRQRHDKLTRYLDMTASEIDRIAAILNRMRDFYRPATPEMRSTNVHSVLHSVLELVDKHLQRSRITVEREWAADLPAIVANADHLKQVFLNLVLNAIDAMTTGGTLGIHTRPDYLVAPNGRSLPAVRIEFSDTGEGIPPEALPRIFEPFFTAKPGGTGLGLSISYGIIQAHNGQITASSHVRQGTTFTIVLPVDQP